MKRHVLAFACITLLLSSVAIAQSPERKPVLTLFEVSKQVSIIDATAFRIDLNHPADPRVGDTLLLNSDLFLGGTLVQIPFPHIEGGKNIGVMHGLCTTVGANLKLSTSANEPNGLVAKCEQSIIVQGRGQIVISGMINQTAFEAGMTQVLAITGGTGDFQRARGEVRITQVTFPGIIKKIEISLLPF
jgi:hypothetical protein